MHSANQYVVARPENALHARCNDRWQAQEAQFSRLTTDVPRPIFREDLRGRLASVINTREAGSEDCFFTQRRNGARKRSRVVARSIL
jgi:hypothetical protein